MAKFLFDGAQAEIGALPIEGVVVAAGISGSVVGSGSTVTGSLTSETSQPTPIFVGGGRGFYYGDRRPPQVREPERPAKVVRFMRGRAWCATSCRGSLTAYRRVREDALQGLLRRLDDTETRYALALAEGHDLKLLVAYLEQELQELEHHRRRRAA